MPAKDDPAKEDGIKEESKTDQEKVSSETEKEEVKVAQPTFKVEEKQSDVEVEKPTPPEEETDEKLNDQPRKITSFSQLDTKSPNLSKSEVVPDQTKTEAPTLPETDEKYEETEVDQKQSQGEVEKDQKKEVSSEEIKEWLHEVRPEKKEKKEKKGSMLKVLVWVIVILIVIGALVGGVFYYKSSFSEDNELKTQPEEEAVVTPTTIPEPTNSESETQEVNIEDYKLRVLNGSGLAGEAGNAADLLKDSGFSDADTGNAESYDFTTTVVELKESVPSSVYDSVKEALGGEYVVEKSEQTIDDSSSYDIVVTVGTRKE